MITTNFGSKIQKLYNLREHYNNEWIQLSGDNILFSGEAIFDQSTC